MWPLLLHWPANTRVLLALAKPCSAPVPVVGSVKPCKMPCYFKFKKKIKKSIYSLYSTRLEATILGGNAPAVPSSLPSICSQLGLWTSLLPNHFSSPSHSAIPTPKMPPNSGKCQRPAVISGPFHALFPVPAPASRAIPLGAPHSLHPLLQGPPWAGSVALCFREQLSTFLASKDGLSSLFPF